MINSLLKKFTPGIFNDGLEKCVKLGKKLITKKKIENFLDVGCSDGNLTLEFAKILKAKNIYGLEYVNDYQTELRKKGIKCLQQDANLKWQYESNFFDFILSSQNIEHVHNTRLYLEECYRILKPGGQVVILTENLSSWINILALVFGWQPFSLIGIDGLAVGNPLHTEVDIDRKLQQKNDFLEKAYQESGISGVAGHVRVLAYRGLKDLMILTGFKNVKMYTTGYLPLKGALSDLMCRLDSRHGHFLICTAEK